MEIPTPDKGVHTSVVDRVCEIFLDRPERKNALNQVMYQQLTDAIHQATHDSAVRVLLLGGRGNCFTSGNDLADFADSAAFADPANPLLTFMRALAGCPKPVVVAVEGVAVGIGTTLLLHCDLIYATPAAVFRLPFVNLGLCPEFASSWLLPRTIGHAKASEWLLLGEEFSAQEAHAAGLINAVVDDPLAVARQQARALAARPPAAVRHTKALIKQSLEVPIQHAMQNEAAVFANALNNAEVKEAVAAFFAKRPPDFSRFE